MATTTTTVKLQGLEDVQRRLEAIPAKLANKVLKDATVQGAKTVALAARNYAPVETGTLRRAIKWVRGRKIWRGDVRQFVKSFVTIEHGYHKTGKKKGQAVKNDAFYWRWVEFGHLVVGRGKAGSGKSIKQRGLSGLERSRALGAASGGHVPARPYLRPALHESAQRVFNQVGDAIKAKLDQVVK